MLPIVISIALAADAATTGSCRAVVGEVDALDRGEDHHACSPVVANHPAAHGHHGPGTDVAVADRTKIAGYPGGRMSPQWYDGPAVAAYPANPSEASAQ